MKVETIYPHNLINGFGCMITKLNPKPRNKTKRLMKSWEKISVVYMTYKRKIRNGTEVFKSGKDTNETFLQMGKWSTKKNGIKAVI